MLMSSGSASDAGVAAVNSSVLTKEESTTNKQFLELLRSLKDVHIADNELFKNPVFANLYDFSVDIKPETAGRQNPFAPLGTDKGGARSGSSAGSVESDTPLSDSSF